MKGESLSRIVRDAESDYVSKAERCLESSVSLGVDSARAYIAAAQVYATLAQVSALDALTEMTGAR